MGDDEHALVSVAELENEVHDEDVVEGVVVAPVERFEGQLVVGHEVRLPSISVEAPASYRRGSILKLQLEVRVRDVSYVEKSDGLIRKHVFEVQDIDVLEKLDPATVVDEVGGSAAGGISMGDDDNGDDAVGG